MNKKGLEIAPAREYSPQEITAYYRGRIDALQLHEVSLEVASINDGIAVLRIVGGFNRRGCWDVYCDQIKAIINSFNRACVVSLNNDVLDDVWYLQINCENELH